MQHRKMIQLGDLCTIRRCQWGRVDPSQGEQYREVSMDDAMSGAPFLFNPGRLVGINLESRRLGNNYLIEEGDTLLCFRGTKYSVGTCAGVVETPESPTIPAGNVLIMRAYDPDLAPWIFLLLAGEDFRQSCLDISSQTVSRNTTFLCMSMKKLHGIVVEPPEEDAVMAARDLWEVMSDKVREAKDATRQLQMMVTAGTAGENILYVPGNSDRQARASMS